MQYSKRWFWLFVAPALMTFSLVVIVPLMHGFYFSFTDWDGINNQPAVVGFQNYLEAFTQGGSFLRAFSFTSIFALSTVLTVNLVAFGLALIVTQPFRGATTLRSLFFLPNLIGGLILGFVWLFVFNKVFPTLGEMFHLPFLNGWLSTPITGFFGLVIIFTWKLSGYMMIIYVAGIQTIPPSLLEAADIDGVSWWQKIRHITFPMVAPAFTVGMFLALSGAFKLYDENFALTNGGPFESTQMMAMDVYNTAFEYLHFGAAQAKAILFLLIVASLSLIQMSINKKREVEM